MPENFLNVRDNYLEQMVESAPPEGLLMMLVEGAANFIRRAIVELEKERLDEVHNCLVKAQNIYLELVISLDLDAGEFAENLALIYQFLYNLLIEANLDKNVEKMNQALKLADEIRTLWKEAIDKSRADKGSVKQESVPVPEKPVEKVAKMIAYGTTSGVEIPDSLINQKQTPANINITA